jgi:hypothetical protein
MPTDSIRCCLVSRRGTSLLPVQLNAQTATLVASSGAALLHTITKPSPCQTTALFFVVETCLNVKEEMGSCQFYSRRSKPLRMRSPTACTTMSYACCQVSLLSTCPVSLVAAVREFPPTLRRWSNFLFEVGVDGIAEGFQGRGVPVLRGMVLKKPYDGRTESDLAAATSFARAVAGDPVRPDLLLHLGGPRSQPRPVHRSEGSGLGHNPSEYPELVAG